MEQIAQKPTIKMCAKHSDKEIQFVQVHGLSNSQNNSLFYCAQCVQSDPTITGTKCLLTSEIIKERDINIISEWPPVNDYTILNQLIQFTKQEDQSLKFRNQIAQFFTDLQGDIHKQIKSKMIKQVVLPLGKESILKQYQEISQIGKLKSILIGSEGKKNQGGVQQQSDREFILEMESKRSQNSKSLTNLLEQCKQMEQSIHFEQPNRIKNDILSLIGGIDFSQSKVIENSKRFSNKSQNISIQSYHSKDQQTGVSSRLQNGANSKKIQKSKKKLTFIILFLSFVMLCVASNIFLYIETLQNKKFDCLKALSEQEIEDLYLLVQKREDLNKENEYNSSQTKKIKDRMIHVQIRYNTEELLYEFENVDEIFRKYPIFDLMLKKQQQRKPIAIQLTRTSYNDGELRKQIHDQYIGIEYSLSSNFVSDIVLQKNKKYLFRFKIEHDRSDMFYVMIGLMQKSQSDSYEGYKDNLSLYLMNNNNQIAKKGGFGIDTHLKGEEFKLSQENEIEMQVWLDEQQLEILDYPNYQHKIQLEDEYRGNLIQWNDLALYIGLGQSEINVKLISAVEVDYFLN